MLDWLEAYLKDHWRDFTDSDSPVGEIDWLIQSRSRILAFAFPKKARWPLAVAKITRDEETARRTINEYETLVAIRECLAPPWLDTLPVPVALERVGKRTVAWERFLVGHPYPLDAPLSLFKRDSELFAQVYRWLVNFQSQCVYGVQALDENAIASSITQTLSPLLRQYDFSRCVDERMFSLAKKLQGFVIPRVHRHGDLHPTNLIFQGNCLQGVTDWEMAVRDVWPFYDWFQFLFEYHLELARKHAPASNREAVLQLAVKSLFDKSRRAETVRVWTTRFLANYGIAYEFAPLLWLHYAWEVHWHWDKELFLGIFVPAVVRWAKWDR